MLLQRLQMTLRRNILARISNEIYMRIKQKAIDEDRSVSYVCRQILTKEFRENEK